MDVSIECPKCVAPMLFVRNQCVCYACGTTFDMDEDLGVSRRLGIHNWDDHLCPRVLQYDSTRSASWHEGLDPEDTEAWKGCD